LTKTKRTNRICLPQWIEQPPLQGRKVRTFIPFHFGQGLKR